MEEIPPVVIGDLVYEWLGDNSCSVRAKDPATLAGDIVVPGLVEFPHYAGDVHVSLIAPHGFENSKITSISIGSYRVTVGEYAFNGCSLLKSAVVDGGAYDRNNAFSDIHEKAFSGSAIEEIVISPYRDIFENETVTITIGAYAFMGCHLLKRVKFNQWRSFDPERQAGYIVECADTCFFDTPRLGLVTIPDDTPDVYLDEYIADKFVLKEAQMSITVTPDRITRGSDDIPYTETLTIDAHPALGQVSGRTEYDWLAVSGNQITITKPYISDPASYRDGYIDFAGEFGGEFRFGVTQISRLPEKKIIPDAVSLGVTKSGTIRTISLSGSDTIKEVVSSADWITATITPNKTAITVEVSHVPPMFLGKRFGYISLVGETTTADANPKIEVSQIGGPERDVIPAKTIYMPHTSGLGLFSVTQLNPSGNSIYFTYDGKRIEDLPEAPWLTFRLTSDEGGACSWEYQFQENASSSLSRTYVVALNHADQGVLETIVFIQSQKSDAVFPGQPVIDFNLPPEKEDVFQLYFEDLWVPYFAHIVCVPVFIHDERSFADKKRFFDGIVWSLEYSPDDQSLAKDWAVVQTTTAPRDPNDTTFVPEHSYTRGCVYVDLVTENNRDSNLGRSTRSVRLIAKYRAADGTTIERSVTILQQYKRGYLGFVNANVIPSKDWSSKSYRYSTNGSRGSLAAIGQVFNSGSFNISDTPLLDRIYTGGGETNSVSLASFDGIPFKKWEDVSTDQFESTGIESARNNEHILFLSDGETIDDLMPKGDDPWLNLISGEDKIGKVVIANKSSARIEFFADDVFSFALNPDEHSSEFGEPAVFNMRVGADPHGAIIIAPSDGRSKVLAIYETTDSSGKWSLATNEFNRNFNFQHRRISFGGLDPWFFDGLAEYWSDLGGIGAVPGQIFYDLKNRVDPDTMGQMYFDTTPFFPSWLSRPAKISSEDAPQSEIGNFFTKTRGEYRSLVIEDNKSEEPRCEVLTFKCAIDPSASVYTYASMIVEQRGSGGGETSFKVSVAPELVPSGDLLPEGEEIIAEFKAEFTGYAWGDVLLDPALEKIDWLTFELQPRESDTVKKWTVKVSKNLSTGSREQDLKAYVSGITVSDSAKFYQSGKEAPVFNVQPKEIFDENGTGGNFSIRVIKSATLGEVVIKDVSGDPVHGGFFEQRFIKESEEGGEIIVSLGVNTHVDALSGEFVVSENKLGLSERVSIKQASKGTFERPKLKLADWKLLNPGYAVLFYEKEGKPTIDIYDAQSKKLISSLDADYPTHTIDKIRWKTVNDVMYVVHPDRIPRKIIREHNADKTDYVFRIEDCEFELTPCLDEEVDSDTSFSVETIHTSETAQVGDLCMQSPLGQVWLEGVVFEITKNPEVTQTKVNDGLISFDLTNLQGRFKFTTRDTPSVDVGDLINSLVDASFSFYIKIEYDVSSSSGTSSFTNSTLFSLKTILRSSKLTVSSLSETIIETEDASLSLRLNYHSASSMRPSLRIKSVAVTNQDFNKLSDQSRLLTTSRTSTFPEGFFRRKKIGSNNTDYIEFFEPANAYGKELVIRESTGLPEEDAESKLSFFKEADTWRIGQTFYLKPKQESVAYSGALVFTDVGVDFPSNIDNTATPNKPVVAQDDLGGAKFISDWFPAVGKITLSTAGKWGGTIVLEEMQKDGDIVELLRISGMNGMNNEKRSRDIISRGSKVRVRVASRARAKTKVYTFSGQTGSELRYEDVNVDTGCYWALSVDLSSEIYFKITAMFDGYAYARCLSSLGQGFSTDNWAEGAWCSKYGYPRHVSVFQERMVFGGNYKKPTTLWLSKTNDWEDFEKGTDDTSPITATAIVDGFDELYWMNVSRNNLIVGTAWREWNFGNTGGNGVVTPSGYSFTSISNYGGTDGLDGVIFSGQLVTAKAGGEELRAIDYNAMTEETTGEEISMFAEHLFSKNPIRRLAVTVAPTSRLWALTEDGRILCLTYNKENEVFAWSQNELLDGVVDFISVRREERDILVLLLWSEGELLLGELDPESDVWTDDGKPYESTLIPTPLPTADNDVYGRRPIFAGCDIYCTNGKRFNARLSGGQWVRVDAGFAKDGKTLNELEKKITLKATSGWTDEAIVEIKTDVDAPLVISAIGANIRSSS